FPSRRRCAYGQIASSSRRTWNRRRAAFLLLHRRCPRKGPAAYRRVGQSRRSVDRQNQKQESTQMKQVGIIGGGLGGLASACVLAARGYEVIVFERNDWFGGKAAAMQSA